MDTGATVSLIKPTVSSALITESDVVIRGANGQKVKTFGTQTVKFLMGSEQFEFKFVISDIRISAAGIIGMDFLRYVGARIDVQSNSLVIGRQTVTLINTDLQSCNVASVSGKSGSVSAMASQSSTHDQLDWSGPILLAESVVLPPHTVKIVRGKVMGRHNLSCNPKTSQVLLVEPTSDQDGLPGIHVARSISQLGNFRTIVNDARGHSSLVDDHGSGYVRKVSMNGQKNCDRNKSNNCVPHCNASGQENFPTNIKGLSQSKNPSPDKLVGSDEQSLMILSVNGAAESAFATGKLDDRPVLNKETIIPVNSQGQVRQINNCEHQLCESSTFDDNGEVLFCSRSSEQGVNVGLNRELKLEEKLVMENAPHEAVNVLKCEKILGYVPIQIVNFSPEPVSLVKHRVIGEASVANLGVDQESEIANEMNNSNRTVNMIDRETKRTWNTNRRRAKDNYVPELWEFEKFLDEKLGHLQGKDRRLMIAVLRKYKHLFYVEGSPEIGCASEVKHSINTGDALPVKKNPYRIPHALKSVVEEQINDMLDKKIIEPSTSPWASPIVLVPKKSQDGTVKHRLCIDYRGLNAVTKSDAYPLPNIVETLDSLGKCKVFSVLDLASGYLQIPIDEKDKEKTAFTCHMGHYQYNRMPFGLQNAPSTFMRCIDFLLMGLKGTICLAYLDDILIMSEDIATHVKNLEKVFVKLQEINFKIQPSKCTFATDQVEYLGHIVSREGVKPDPQKIKAIRDYPQPRSVRDIRSFVGLASYYRRHIPNFAAIAKPLTMLTRKDVEFKWGTSQEEAFRELKAKLSTEPLLSYPDFSLPFIVTTDASQEAVGAVLSQKINGEEKPVAYCSRQLNAAERNYSCTERELLAVIFATKQFRCYLYGRKFTLHTDHAALRWLLNLKDPSSRLTRWSLRLAEFDYEVIHKPGKKLPHADALSRHVGIVTSDSEFNLTEELILSEQLADDQLIRLIEFDDFHKDNNGLLCRHSPAHGIQVVIPRSLIATVIKHYHDNTFMAHQGTKRTIAAIKLKYWWPTMSSDIQEYIGSCDKCAKRKIGKSQRAPLGDAVAADDFMDTVSLDIVGPLPTTESGNKYLLTFVDHFTRFCEAIPIPDQSAETVAKEFVTKIIAQWGTPNRLLTDQGTQFTSKLFSETCRLLMIKKIQTTSYHPQSNGVCERMHKLLVDMLSHYVHKDGKNWDKFVPYAIMAYRATPHTVTTFSPYYLVFGRHMKLPIEDRFIQVKRNLGRKQNSYDSYEAHVKLLADRIRVASQVVRQQSKRGHEQSKAHYDKRAREREFNAGDIVYLYDPVASRSKAKKFAYHWTGPFEIIEKLSNLVYTVKISEEKCINVHINRLKECNSRHMSSNDATVIISPPSITSEERNEETPEQNMEPANDELSETAKKKQKAVNKRCDDSDKDWEPGTSVRRQNKDKETITSPYKLRDRGNQPRKYTFDSDEEIDDVQDDNGETNVANSELNNEPSHDQVDITEEVNIVPFNNAALQYPLRNRLRRICEDVTE